MIGQPDQLAIVANPPEVPAVDATVYDAVRGCRGRIVQPASSLNLTVRANPSLVLPSLIGPIDLLSGHDPTKRVVVFTANSFLARLRAPASADRPDQVINFPTGAFVERMMSW